MDGDQINNLIEHLTMLRDRLSRHDPNAWTEEVAIRHVVLPVLAEPNAGQIINDVLNGRAET